MQRGFTLIEILVVIVIISVVSAIAILTIHFNEKKQFETITKQLINLLQLAEQEALLRPATLGLGITANTYQFFIYEEKDKKWQPLTDNNLKIHHLPNSTVLTLHMQDKEVAMDGQPHIIIPPSGNISPFTLSIGKKDDPAYKIIGKENGEINFATIE